MFHCAPALPLVSVGLDLTLMPAGFLFVLHSRAKPLLQRSLVASVKPLLSFSLCHWASVFCYSWFPRDTRLHLAASFLCVVLYCLAVWAQYAAASRQKARICSSWICCYCLFLTAAAVNRLSVCYSASDRDSMKHAAWTFWCFHCPITHIENTRVRTSSDWFFCVFQCGTGWERSWELPLTGGTEPGTHTSVWAGFVWV